MTTWVDLGLTTQLIILEWIDYQWFINLLILGWYLSWLSQNPVWKNGIPLAPTQRTEISGTWTFSLRGCYFLNPRESSGGPPKMNPPQVLILWLKRGRVRMYFMKCNHSIWVCVHKSYEVIIWWFLTIGGPRRCEWLIAMNDEFWMIWWLDSALESTPTSRWRIYPYFEKPPYSSNIWVYRHRWWSSEPELSGP